MYCFNKKFIEKYTGQNKMQLFISMHYFRMMAQRVTLDSQGRLVLRENGKIILPFEHFGNAVMLKHMNGPQGMHLGLEATIRAVRIRIRAVNFMSISNLLI